MSGEVCPLITSSCDVHGPFSTIAFVTTLIFRIRVNLALSVKLGADSDLVAAGEIDAFFAGGGVIYLI